LWSRRRPSPSPWLPLTSACSTRWPCGSVEHEIKCPCQLLDEASWHDQKAPPSPTAKPFLHPEGDPGGHAFLAAKPGGDVVTHMDNVIFVTEIRHRRNVPEATRDQWHP
jgi:hypothetical protein